MKQPSRPDMYILNPEIESYIESLTPLRDEVLLEMEDYARKSDFPIVGPLVGRFLYQLTLISGAERIMELGSGFGYSAFWFAKAIAGSGSVIFTDISSENAALAEQYLKRAGLREKIDIRTGNALDIIDKSEGEFDIIFNDIDKEFYPEVVERASAKLRKGGLFITDNVLWSGRVLGDDPSPSTEGVREFTRLLLSEKGFYTTIIPLRDGLSLSVKL
jgi:caffeoyl-CoA O-methyltransferase